MLNLPGFKVLDWEVKDNQRLYAVEPLNNRPTTCPTCGGTLHVHRRLTLHVQDLPAFDNRVGLEVQHRTYRCADCGDTFSPEYDQIDGRFTKRFKEQLKKETLNFSFRELAARYGISDVEVGRLFREKKAEIEENYVLETPRVLGIDEVHFQKHYFGVLVKVNKEDGQIIEMTETRTVEMMTAVLQAMQHKENLRCVTMDMYKPYVTSVRSVFPDVPIVIDRFHVIKELLRCIETKRRALSHTIKQQKVRASLKNNRFLILGSGDQLTPTQKERLDQLFKNYPQFQPVYELKEAFRSIYEFAKTREEAEEMYAEWLEESKDITELDDFKKTVSRWHDLIFNYFSVNEESKTNAQTESLNNIIKRVVSQGRGYSFPAIRCKMLFRKTEKMPAKFDWGVFEDDDDEE